MGSSIEQYRRMLVVDSGGRASPIRKPWPGYLGDVRPLVISAFCANPSLDPLVNPRHQDCSLPGCTCSCHTHRTNLPTMVSVASLMAGRCPLGISGSRVTPMTAEQEEHKAGGASSNSIGSTGWELIAAAPESFLGDDQLLLDCHHLCLSQRADSATYADFARLVHGKSVIIMCAGLRP
jgi:hypothetical protein